MQEIVQHYELAIRLSFFFGVLTIMGVWETIAPCRQFITSRPLHWLNNLGMVFLNSLLLRLLFPTAAVGMAVFTQTHGWGIFNYIELPFWLNVIICVISLDFIIYLQHVLVHAVPALWRLHRVHHADMDFDVTTGARFHPIEIIFSMLIKFATIIVLGPPVVAVIIFEILLNATAMFNHSNVSLPKHVDKILRLFLVTPDMHRVHHSVEDDEANSNFGFNLPWWDRLFGTYKNQPRLGQIGMTIGIHGFRDPKDVSRLPGMLLLPFKGKITQYVINRRAWENTED